MSATPSPAAPSPDDPLDALEEGAEAETEEKVRSGIQSIEVGFR